MKQARGIGIYVIILLLVVLGIYYAIAHSARSDSYTYSDFLEDYKDDDVKSVTIYQNREVPTGKLVVKLNNGDKHSINVASAADTEERLIELGVSYEMKKVKKVKIEPPAEEQAG